MTIPATLRSRGGISLASLILIGLAIAFSSARALAGDAGGTPHQAFSLIAKPRPQANAFLVAEVDLLLRALNSRQTTEIQFRNGGKIQGDDFGLVAAISGDLGLMLNLSTHSAFGFSGFVTAEEFRHRAGLRARYRFWDIGAGSLEITFGPAVDIAGDRFAKELNRRQWFVGTLSFSNSRLVHILFRVESHLQDYPPDRRVTAAYAGLKFGY